MRNQGLLRGGALDGFRNRSMNHPGVIPWSSLLWLDKILHLETMVETITFLGIYWGSYHSVGFLRGGCRNPQ